MTGQDNRSLEPAPRGLERADRRATVTWRRIAGLAVPLYGTFALLFAWMLYGSFFIDSSSAIPGLIATVQALIDEITSALFWSALVETLTVWGSGFVLGSCVGVAIGALVAPSQFADRSVTVLVEFFRTVPIVAILPLAILVLGTGPDMKTFLVAFGVTWPLVVQTVYGVRSLDPVVSDTAAVMHLGWRRRFFGVIIPTSAPYIATGLRISASGALVLTIVTELIAGGGGLGTEITRAAASGMTAMPRMYALIVVTGLIGMVVAAVLLAVERRALSWHISYRPKG